MESRYAALCNIRRPEFRLKRARRSPPQVRPPLRNHRVQRWFNALAGARREDLHIMATSGHAYAFDRLGPVTESEMQQRTIVIDPDGLWILKVPIMPLR